jgi:hypothetical protein
MAWLVESGTVVVWRVVRGRARRKVVLKSLDIMFSE